MNRRPIIIDCDPGHDDALAILLAAGSPDIEILGITTVAGNQTIERVTRNALAACAWAGIRVPVAAGATKPFLRDQITAGEIHGASGMDGPELPVPLVDLDPRHAVTLIIDTVMNAEPRTVTLVPIGPLTNIALALRQEPRLAERVKRVSLMGGAYAVHGRSPVTEFNIAADPESAAVVFDAGWPITMAPLDLTYQALATDDVIARFGEIPGHLGGVVVELLEFFSSRYRAERGLAAAPVHDPCAIACLIDPGVFTTRPATVVVETGGTYARGQTVTDFLGQLGRPVNADVAIELDRERFWALMTDAVARLSRAAA